MQVARLSSVNKKTHQRSVATRTKPTISLTQHRLNNLNYQNTFSGTRNYTTFPRGKDRIKPDFKSGDNVDGWTVQQVTPLPDFKLTAVRLKHDKTGARYIHMDTDDQNNTFMITFKTPPKDDTGLPHILEHTTLCGSKKYPIRDPFFNMMKRSLNTFMNAMTGLEHTSYPFATQNVQDFENILSVYLDATLFPNLSHMDFKQEGHRLEFSQPENPSSPLQVKGVVYNEMKGSMGEPLAVFAHKLFESLYPNSIYRHQFGGDPEAIPQLKWEELKRFHQEHYHPSNAYIYTYGDLPLDNHIRMINQYGFNQFDRGQEHFIGDLPPLEEPVRKHIYGPPEPAGTDPEKQSRMVVAFRTNDLEDVLETFTLAFIGHMLFNNPRGPLYKSLVESELAPSLADGCGYVAEIYKTHFVAGVQNIRESAFDEVEKTIHSTLRQVAEEGFEQSLYDASLQQLELHYRQKPSLFGLAFASTILPYWFNSESPESHAFVSENVAALKNEMKKNPNFLRDKVRKYLVDNNQTVTLSMSPDPEYVQNQETREAQMLDDIESKLSDNEKSKIVEDAQELSKYQEKSEDLSVLPTLKISDIPRDLVEKSPLYRLSDNQNIYLNPQSTNGVVHVRTLFDISEIPHSLVQLLPLFATALTRIGARDMDYKQLAERVDLYTGGIDANIELIPDLNNSGKGKIGLAVSGHCLEQNVFKMIDLMIGILESPNFQDETYLRQLIHQSMVQLSTSVTEAGHSFARLESAGPISNLAKLDRDMHGFPQIDYLANLVQNPNRISEVIEALTQLAQGLLRRDFMRVMVTAESNFVEQAGRYANDIFDALPEPYLRSQDAFNMSSMVGDDEDDEVNHTVNTYMKEAGPCTLKTYTKMPFPVNFVAESRLSAPFNHPDSPLLMLGATHVNSNYLHKEIREKGGAYGSGAFQSLGGLFSFYSYRDPNVMRTLDVFDQVPGNSMEWMEGDINESKLELFQQIDTPVSPQHKGLSEFTLGITDEMKQKRRERLLEASRDEVLEKIHEYITPFSLNEEEFYKADENLGEESIEWNHLKGVRAFGVIGTENVPPEIRQDPSWHITNEGGEEEKQTEVIQNK